MSVGTTMSSQPVSVQKVTDAPTPSMVSIAKRQRLQDILFHRLTQSLSLLVLAAWRGRIQERPAYEASKPKEPPQIVG